MPRTEIKKYNINTNPDPSTEYTEVIAHLEDFSLGQWGNTEGKFSVYHTEILFNGKKNKGIMTPVYSCTSEKTPEMEILQKFVPRSLSSLLEKKGKARAYPRIIAYSKLEQYENSRPCSRISFPDVPETWTFLTIFKHLYLLVLHSKFSADFDSKKWKELKKAVEALDENDNDKNSKKTRKEFEALNEKKEAIDLIDTYFSTLKETTNFEERCDLVEKTFAENFCDAVASPFYCASNDEMKKKKDNKDYKVETLVVRPSFDDVPPGSYYISLMPNINDSFKKKDKTPFRTPFMKMVGDKMVSEKWSKITGENGGAIPTYLGRCYLNFYDYMEGGKGSKFRMSNGGVSILSEVVSDGEARTASTLSSAYIGFDEDELEAIRADAARGDLDGNDSGDEYESEDESSEEEKKKKNKKKQKSKAKKDTPESSEESEEESEEKPKSKKTKSKKIKEESEEESKEEQPKSKKTKAKKNKEESEEEQSEEKPSKRQSSRKASTNDRLSDFTKKTKKSKD